MRALAWLALAGCPPPEPPSSTDPAWPTHPADVPRADQPEVRLFAAPPTLRPPDDPAVHLVQLLQVQTTAPTTLSVVIDDGQRARRIEPAGQATEHTLPLLQLLAETPHEVQVTATDALGRSEVAQLQLTPPPLAPALPQLQLLERVEGAFEPGVTLAALRTPDGSAYTLVGLDDLARPIWAFESPDELWDVALRPDGTLTAILDNQMAELTVLGGLSVISETKVHHDAQWLDDGTYLALVKQNRQVADYPIDLSDLSARQAVTIRDDAVVHLDSDGTLLRGWPASELLDPTRVGLQSLDQHPDGTYDWGHANAVLDSPADNSIVVSLRHQDCVFKFDRDTLQIRWILGNHDGWPPELQPHLLQPVGPISWPFRQHAPMPVGSGSWVLFDNGNVPRGTPYSDTPDPLGRVSRAVVYTIDEDAMTIRQTSQLVGDGRGDPLFANALGDADALPITGNVLASFAYLKAESGVDNLAAGRGLNSVRLIEFDPETQQVVWDLSLHSRLEDTPEGWLLDRVERVPSLYAGIATVTEL